MTRLALIFLLVVTTSSVKGQPTPGGGGPPGGGGAPVPLTGVEWLIAGGALLGMRRILKSKKKD